MTGGLRTAKPCSPPGHGLFRLTKIMRKPAECLSDPLRAEEVNQIDFIVERAAECWIQHGKRPTFVAVDWWEDGDVVEAVRQINLMDAPAI